MTDRWLGQMWQTADQKSTWVGEAMSPNRSHLVSPGRHILGHLNLEVAVMRTAIVLKWKRVERLQLGCQTRMGKQQPIDLLQPIPRNHGKVHGGPRLSAANGQCTKFHGWKLSITNQPTTDEDGNGNNTSVSNQGDAPAGK